MIPLQIVHHLFPTFCQDSGLPPVADCALESEPEPGNEAPAPRERELGRVKRREGWGSCPRQSSHSPAISHHEEMEMTWINVITGKCPDLSSILHIPVTIIAIHYKNSPSLLRKALCQT